MNPSVWGPHAWAFLHAFAESFPENPTETQKQDAVQFLHQLAKVLPCESCRGHFANLLASNQPNVNSGFEFRKWVHGAHNIVNKRLNKPEVDFAERLKSLAIPTASVMPIATTATAALLQTPDCNCNTEQPKTSDEWFKVAFALVVFCGLVFLFSTTFCRGGNSSNSGSTSGSSNGNASVNTSFAAGGSSGSGGSHKHAIPGKVV